mgnify:CR=1 FL=1
MALFDSIISAAAEKFGLDGSSMEAEAFAYLAVRSMRGLPLTFPMTTGCRSPATGGVLVRTEQAHERSA